MEREKERIEDELERYRGREQRLVEMMGLLSHKISLNDLLDRLVRTLREATVSDAGSIYLVEEYETLRFAVAQTDSCEIPFTSFTIPISDSTIAGYVAKTGETLRFADVYAIDASYPFHFNADFDKKFGYRTRSMIAAPLKNQKNEIIGVVQLINRKTAWEERVRSPEDADRCVLPYTNYDEDFLNILAAAAAIAIERASLYEGIERLLRGIVESSAASIESRDKTTAGHSQRIAAYMVVLAKRIDKCQEGFWKDVHFDRDQIREVFYAAMLHDIGKIGVREHVLTKANKLSDDRLETIRLRIELQKMREPERAEEWDEIFRFISEVNIPGFLEDERYERLKEIAGIPIVVAGQTRPLLDDFEFENLSVRKGNLTEAERKEIESHVAHSLEILKRIPWTDDLKNVPIIAGTHHEKLNGKGYPSGLRKEEIPLEGRMLAVVDIFEALTAMDRPYKRAMPVEKALEILRTEAKFGGLQSEIVEFFIEKKVYEVISDELRKNFTLTSEEILALE